VSLKGDLAVDTLVAQGCRPIGTPLFVTGVEGTSITSLDGEAPVTILHQLFESLDERDRELLQYALFLGLVMRDGLSSYGPGDFLIRNLIGIDPASGALAVAEHIRVGQVVQFHLRDADTSSADLEAHLAAFRRRSPGRPSGALMFSCLGRGEHLYGRPGHDSSLVRNTLGPLPMAGFFCNGEIGPVHGRTFLHGYTSSIAFFRPR
jgi:small ligand-binding sensory domain FIST